MIEPTTRFQVMLLDPRDSAKQWRVPESPDGRTSKLYETADEATKEMHDFWLTDDSGLRKTYPPLRFAVVEIKTTKRPIYATIDYLM